VAQTLKVRPRNLKHRQWQHSVSDAHIQRVIRDGGKSVNLSDQMPPFGDKLNEAELRTLTSYIRLLGGT
jgi:mono/diheme cytochrome c family protein